MSSSVFGPQSLTTSGKALGLAGKTFPTGGPSDNQTVLWGCVPQDSLITLGPSIGKKIPENTAAFPLFVPFAATSDLQGIKPPQKFFVATSKQGRAADTTQSWAGAHGFA